MRKESEIFTKRLNEANDRGLIGNKKTFCDSLCISRSQLHGYLKGTEPGIDIAGRIARKLGYGSLGEMLGNGAAPSPAPHALSDCASAVYRALSGAKAKDLAELYEFAIEILSRT